MNEEKYRFFFFFFFKVKNKIVKMNSDWGTYYFLWTGASIYRSVSSIVQDDFYKLMVENNKGTLILSQTAENEHLHFWQTSIPPTPQLHIPNLKKIILDFQMSRILVRIPWVQTTEKPIVVWMIDEKWKKNEIKIIQTLVFHLNFFSPDQKVKTESIQTKALSLHGVVSEWAGIAQGWYQNNACFSTCNLWSIKIK